MLNNDSNCCNINNISCWKIFSIMMNEGGIVLSLHHGVFIFVIINNLIGCSDDLHKWAFSSQSLIDWLIDDYSCYIFKVLAIITKSWSKKICVSFYHDQKLIKLNWNISRCDIALTNTYFVFHLIKFFWFAPH